MLHVNGAQKEESFRTKQSLKFIGRVGMLKLARLAHKHTHWTSCDVMIHVLDRVTAMNIIYNVFLCHFPESFLS